MAVARQLQRRSIPSVLLEQSTTGHVWAEHYDGLRLHTPKEVSALPCRRMPAELPRFPTGEQVRDYLAEYRDHFGLDVREGTVVDSARWCDGAWELATSAGPFEASALVAATGIWSRPVRPDLPGLSEFPGEVLHSAEYRNAVPYLNRRVLVVGAGNSGCEIAVGLADAGASVTLSVRSRVLFVPRPSSALFSSLSATALRLVPDGVVDVLVDQVRPDHSDIGLPPPQHSADTYPVVGDELPDAVRAGRVELAGAVDRLEGDTAVFDDGSSRQVDAIVLATGFRPALDWLDGRAIRWSDRGTPVVDRYWRSVVHDRLCCVGFDYPNTEGWLQAVGRVSKRAAIGVERSLRAP